MKRLVVHLVNGTYARANIDGTKVVDGVLYTTRASYNGGIQETVKAFPLASVLSWEVES